MSSTIVSPKRQILLDNDLPLLIDVHPVTGEIVPWHLKKAENLKLAESCRRIAVDDPAFIHRAPQLENCANYLEYWRYHETGERKLKKAFF